jgi:hypothetical protein
MSARLAEGNRPGEEAVARMIDAVPTALESNETLLDTFRRVARAELSIAECDATFSLTSEAYAGIVASCVSRLVEVCDPVMRHRLAEAAPGCEPATWLDQQSLALARDGWMDLFERWPVLPFVVGTALSQWRASVLEMLRRLASDIDVLATSILGQEPGQLDEVSLGAGDRHAGGRSVALLRFTSGGGVVYKPRDLSAGVALSALLELLNDAGLVPNLATRCTLVRDGYGFEERLEPAAVAEPSGFSRYYERLGALIRVMELLGARDMWADNLLAVGDQPHFIDLECVGCPSFDPPPMLSAARQLLFLRRETTVLSTAIPLAALPPTPRCPTWDIGCLSHADDPIDQGGGALPIGPFRPFDAEGSADPWCYTDEIERGYRAAHAALVGAKEALLAPDGPLAGLDRVEGRFLWRDTFQYIVMLHASLAPSALESCAAREAVLEAVGQSAARAATGVETKFDVARLSAMEIDALRILDVPLFGTRGGDTAIHGPGGDLIPDQFSRSGAEALHDRVAHLGTNDVEVAVAFLRAAMDAARSGRGDPVVVRPRRWTVRSRAPEVETLVREIAELLATARRPPYGTGEGWLSVCLDPGTGMHDVIGAGIDLLGGALGPALVFAELEAIVGGEGFGRLAVDTIDELLTAATAGVPPSHGMLVSPTGASGLMGACALVAVGARVAAATGDEGLDDRLMPVREAVLVEAMDAVERDDPFHLAPLHHHILGWSSARMDAMRIAAVLGPSCEVLSKSAATSPAGREWGVLDGLVPTGADAVDAALAATWAVTPFLLDDAASTARSLAARPVNHATRGGRLAQLIVSSSGIVDPMSSPPPPRWRDGLDSGSLVLLADEWQLRSRIVADRRSSIEAARCTDELLARRREHGRFLPGRVADDARCLSATGGLCAVGRVLLRVLEPSLPPAGVPG